ncbi:Hypp5691 [Branchiostoma lanceolatum]|uniref:Hypp5691 protein n=1 Tax=Branchiostoma lanceolatum TaxID=7740 RepID=A0A8J9W776_BRALA|nr:Hypp5691 [Branchiostoma lanceolatum]
MTTSDEVTTPLQVTTPSSISTCSTPCHLYATCVTGQSGYTCVCSSGYQGNGVTCTLAAQQVSLEMTMNIPYTSDLADSTSQAFRTLAQSVSTEIFVYLSSSSSGLLSVTVSSFRPGSVVATVNANFQQNASVSSSGVVNSLKQAVANDTENPLGLNTSSISL